MTCVRCDRIVDSSSVHLNIVNHKSLISFRWWLTCPWHLYTIASMIHFKCICRFNDIRLAILDDYSSCSSIKDIAILIDYWSLRTSIPFMLDINERERRKWKWLYQIMFEGIFFLPNQLSHQLTRLSQGWYVESKT